MPTFVYAIITTNASFIFMCFHNSMTRTAIELAARYRRKYWKEIDTSIFEKYHVSAFTNPNYPIITADEQLQVMKWGLIPFWEKTAQGADEIRKLTYNAKAETVFEKPLFRQPIKSHRCIVPSTGFFEWHHNSDKTKTPYYIRLKNEEIFSMAGIFDVWESKENGEILHTFSIITTEANPMLAELHNSKRRMPVVLPSEVEERWLKPDLGKEEIQSLLAPFDEKQMEAWIVGSDLLKKNPHDKTIVERINR